MLSNKEAVYRDILLTWIDDEDTTVSAHEESNGICVIAWCCGDDVNAVADSSYEIIFNRCFKNAIEEYLGKDIELQTYFNEEQMNFLKNVCNLETK